MSFCYLRGRALEEHLFSLSVSGCDSIDADFPLLKRLFSIIYFVLLLGEFRLFLAVLSILDLFPVEALLFSSPLFLWSSEMGFPFRL